MFNFKLAFKRAQAETAQFHQGELADKIGISQNTLAAILYRNSPASEKLEMIANKGFGMTMSEFVALGEE
jgi:transcriptional regulator with XRE-family HTH domain